MEHHRVLPSKSNKKRHEGDSRYRTIIIIQEMKKKLIFIQLCIDFILYKCKRAECFSKQSIGNLIL